MKRQLGFMFRILFWDAVMICVLVFAFTYAHAQNEQITVGSYELGRGIIAPDALAIIHGGAFTFESKQVSMFDSLTEIGGVQVWIGGKERGQLAQLRYVGYDTISFVMPSASSLQQLGWQQVEVSAPLGQYSALVFIAPVSAEIFTNHCIDSPSCINRMPFGLAWVNNSIIIPTLNEPIPNNNTQVSLFGTGLRRSARILVWITDELDGQAVVEGRVAPHSFFIGWDVVSFPLPATIQRDGREVPLRGKITVQLAAAQPSPLRWWSFANSIELTVME